MNKNGIWMYLGIFLTLQQGFQLSKSWPRHRFGSKGLGLSSARACRVQMLEANPDRWDIKMGWVEQPLATIYEKADPWKVREMKQEPVGFLGKQTLEGTR